MTGRSTRVAALFVTLVAVAALTIAMRVQAAPVTPQQDILPALLTEVKGLRAAMEQMAAAGPRVQLALGRLQLQEQRLNTMIRRLESVRDSRTSLESALLQHQSILKDVEASVVRNEPAGRQEREESLENIKRELTRISTELQRVSAEETALAADIAVEQGRWNSINQQLEELERSLGRR